MDKHRPVTGSRLVRALSDLAVSDVQVSHRHFARRLGRLIDLSDSISLSSVHGEMKNAHFEAGPASGEAITAEFLRVRNGLVSTIVKSFSPGQSRVRIRFPRAESDAPDAGGSGYEPYGKFYAAHQRDMEFKIQQLQGQVRGVAAGASPQLAQLASLDKALGDTLQVHTRKFFASIPRLLSRRFEHLLSDYDNRTDTWGQLMQLFSRDVQGLLLAEVETRLLPTQGLIEALHTTSESTL